MLGQQCLPDRPPRRAGRQPGEWSRSQKNGELRWPPGRTTCAPKRFLDWARTRTPPRRSRRRWRSASANSEAATRPPACRRRSPHGSSRAATAPARPPPRRGALSRSSSRRWAPRIPTWRRRSRRPPRSISPRVGRTPPRGATEERFRSAKPSTGRSISSSPSLKGWFARSRPGTEPGGCFPGGAREGDPCQMRIQPMRSIPVLVFVLVLSAAADELPGWEEFSVASPNGTPSLVGARRGGCRSRAGRSVGVARASARASRGRRAEAALTAKYAATGIRGHLSTTGRGSCRSVVLPAGGALSSTAAGSWW